MSKEDKQVELAAMIHNQAIKATQMETRLTVLVTEHRGYVVMPVEELTELRDMIHLQRVVMVRQAELLCRVEDGLDKMLDTMEKMENPHA